MLNRTLLLRTQVLKSHQINLFLNANVHSSNQLPQKSSEDPVIVVPENDRINIIGPPDIVSNLRPIIRKKIANESNLQRKLRVLQSETDAWNQEFWCIHNRSFVNERNEFTKQKSAQKGDGSLSNEELSEFYKTFLNKYWSRHVNYNIEWYKRNFKLLWLEFRVNLENNLRKFK